MSVILGNDGSASIMAQNPQFSSCLSGLLALGMSTLESMLKTLTTTILL